MKQVVIYNHINYILKCLINLFNMSTLILIIDSKYNLFIYCLLFVKIYVSF